MMSKKAVNTDKKKIPIVSKKVVVKKKIANAKIVVVSKKTNQPKPLLNKANKVELGTSKRIKPSPLLLKKAIAVNPLNKFKANLGFYRSTRAKCFAFISNVFACMRNNTNFETPSPAISDIEDEIKLYYKTYGVGNSSVSDKHYANIVYMVKQLGVYVANTCGNNSRVFLGSGFKPNKPNTRLKTKMSKIKIKKVKDTKKSGEATVTVERMIGVMFHECQYQEVYVDEVTLKETLGPMIRVPGRTGLKQKFTGLPIGKNVLLYVRAIGPVDEGDWSSGYPWIPR